VGGPPRHKDIDGSVVPAAAAGSLMLAPDLALPAVREIHRRFGAENLRTGRVWIWFMKNPEIASALERAGIVQKRKID
jgi:hypothetical protein